MNMGRTLSSVCAELCLIQYAWLSKRPLCSTTDEVVAKRGFDDVTNAPDTHPEHGLLKLRHHASAAKITQIAPLPAGRAVRMLFGELDEICAVIKLRFEAFDFLERLFTRASGGRVLGCVMHEENAR